MKNLVAIGVGGALGTFLRYFINMQISADFPAGTMIENVSGSLLLGLLTGYFVVKIPKEWVKAGFGVGLCGGYTTFSTFAADTIGLFAQQMVVPALVYIFGTLLLGIIFAMAGFAAGQKTGRARV